MIKAIREKYCNDKLIQLLNNESEDSLIISSDEIIFLKNKNEVLIDKFKDSGNDALFPLPQEAIKRGKFPQLYEYHKTYLNISGEKGSSDMKREYFFEGINRALYFSERLDAIQEEKTVELDRCQIEELFNKDRYDSMYVIKSSGKVIFASTPKDGVVVDRRIIPSDEEIIEIESKYRIHNNALDIFFGKISEDDSANFPSSIDEVRNVDLYKSDVLGKGYIFLITRNGKFSLNYFTIKFIEKNKFSLTYRIVPVINPNAQDLCRYVIENKIEYDREDCLPSENTQEKEKKLDLFFK